MTLLPTYFRPSTNGHLLYGKYQDCVVVKLMTKDGMLGHSVLNRQRFLKEVHKGILMPISRRNQ